MVKVVITCVLQPQDLQLRLIPPGTGMQDPQSRVSGWLRAAVVSELYCQTVEVWNF